MKTGDFEGEPSNFWSRRVTRNLENLSDLRRRFIPLRQARQTIYRRYLKRCCQWRQNLTPGGPGSLLSIPAVGNQNLPDPGQQQQLEQLQQQLEQQQQRLLARALENNLSNTQQQLGSQAATSPANIINLVTNIRATITITFLAAANDVSAPIATWSTATTASLQQDLRQRIQSSGENLCTSTQGKVSGKSHGSTDFI
ncbi:uncharacterized protein LOC122085678 isoform X2 [Macadamia integrifolia]|uniref:uncharacterized protein LOC122085678 isoform X2 n=1 Tax=Macadamia integrifolia TaxID=60698 RepID=UPI001C4F22FF|nr:uncharacterized protein LOC122085678 isoform X2 [Macadamia integrifolia]